jgi:Tat protein secretion system quality control protein TatD with DNase activity
MKYFERQLDLAKACRLPVIFHNRNTGGDFETVVKRRLALNQHHSTSSLTPTEKLAVLLLYCCFTAALLLLYCCFTAALLLLYCCFTASIIDVNELVDTY